MKNFKQNLLSKALVIVALFVAFAAKSQCNASFTYSLGSSGYVQFASTSTGTSSTTNHYWSWGDGSTGWGSSTGHTYYSNGGFYVTLLISDSLSTCWDSTSVYINVTNVTTPTTTPCNLNASFTYSMGANGFVQFTNTSTGTSSNTNTYWYFGNGNASWYSNPSNTYTSAGIYTVTLYLSDSIFNPAACASSFSQTLNITSAPCIANGNFYLAQDSLQALTWNAYPNFGFNITSAIWSWGDGTTSNSLYPSHTYSAAGMYSICVTVSASCGTSTTYCSNSNIYRTSNQLSQAITVNVINPAPTGIKSNSALAFKDVTLYPNPTSEKSQLNINGSANQSLSVNVYNTNGQLVIKQMEALQDGNNSILLNTSDLSPGIYLINLSSNGQNKTMKLVKQ